MIAMTIPRIIPPTNEAPSNFLPPLVGAGVVCCFSGTSVTVNAGPVVLVVVVDEVVVDFIPVGDILVDMEVEIMTGAGTVVSLEATETTKQIHSVICIHSLVHLSVKVVLC